MVRSCTSTSLEVEKVLNKKRKLLQNYETPIKHASKLEKLRKEFDIPNDIILNILLHLPAKTIIKFRLVSKTWNALTSEPYFLVNHNLRAKLSLLAIEKPVNQNLYSIHAVSLSVDKLTVACSITRSNMLMRSVNTLDYIMELEGTCDGMLCFSGRRYIDKTELLNTTLDYKLFKKFSSSKQYEYDSHRVYFYVHNPLTNQWLTLPQLSCEYHFVIAFYFDSISSEYKLLCSFYSVPDNLHKIGILTVGASSWRLINYLPESSLVASDFTPRFLRQCEMLHGKLHWLPNLSDNSTAEWFLIVFDTITEMFHKISLPLGYTHELLAHLFEVGGKLAVLNVLWAMQIEIWILEGYKDEKWIKKPITINIGSELELGIPLKICSASGNDGDLLIYFVRHLVMYNMYSETCLMSTRCDLGFKLRSYSGFFKESLIQHDFFQGGVLDIPSPRSVRWYAEQNDNRNLK